MSHKEMVYKMEEKATEKVQFSKEVNEIIC